MRLIKREERDRQTETEKERHQESNIRNKKVNTTVYIRIRYFEKFDPKAFKNLDKMDECLEKYILPKLVER